MRFWGQRDSFRVANHMMVWFCMSMTTPNDEKPIILVCGFGRCGTSLMMQMLAAGGIPVVGGAPGYEEEVPAGADAAYWLEHYAGRAIKVLDPQRERPPAGLNYKIIWLDRAFRQQALSQIKFIKMMEAGKYIPPAKWQVKRMEKLNIAERPRAIATIYGLAGKENCFGLMFEQLIVAPNIAAKQIWDVLGQYSTLPAEQADAHVLSMAAVVRPRSPENYPGLMELTLRELVEAA